MVKSDVSHQRKEIICIREELKVINSTLQQQKSYQNSFEDEDSLWSLMVKKHVDKKVENVTEEMHEIQKTIIEEKQHMEKVKDKDKRKNYVIIYRLAKILYCC